MTQQLLNNTDTKVQNNSELERRIGWILACMAKDAKYDLYESDVKWIEKNIVTHSLFRTVNQTVQTGYNGYEYHVLFF